MIGWCKLYSKHFEVLGCFKSINYGILAFICYSFTIVVITLLLTDVFARLAHRVCSPTSTADPLESLNQQNI